MEPARDERGDSKVLCGSTLGVRAAMEPARDERGDLPRVRRPAGGAAAAMEPARDERGDLAEQVRWTYEDQPQWSPLAMSGATGLAGGGARAGPGGRNGARSR